MPVDDDVRMPWLTGRPRIMLATLRSRLRAPRQTVRNFARHQFLRLARHFTPVVAVRREDGLLLVAPRDRVVGLVSFLGVDWEPGGVGRATQLLADRGITVAGRDIVEIGANIGTHTRALLADAGARQVVAIEPDPLNCALLRANAALGGAADRVTVLELALSDRSARMQLERSPHNHGDHRLRGPGRPRAAGRETVEVAAVRFDDLVADGTIDLREVGLVWIDVQGHEASVLQGAASLLAAQIPIVLEYWPSGLREAGGLQQLHALLAEHRPTLYDLGTHGGRSGVRPLAAGELETLERERGWSAVGGPAEDAYTDLLALPTGW